MICIIVAKPGVQFVHRFIKVAFQSLMVLMLIGALQRYTQMKTIYLSNTHTSFSSRITYDHLFVLIESFLADSDKLAVDLLQLSNFGTGIDSTIWIHTKRTKKSASCEKEQLVLAEGIQADATNHKPVRGRRVVGDVGNEGRKNNKTD